MTIDEARPPQISLSALFLKFLRFGCLAFGGPVAQIAMIRQALVEEERWLSSSRFNRLLAVMQVLPGPEAHELCVHTGMLARGRIGGLLAGLGFMLPGFLLMLLAAWIYRDWIAGHRLAASALLGIQIAVLAIILRAVHRIAGHVLEDWLGWAIAAASLLLTFAGSPFWIPLVGGGLVYALSTRPGLAAGVAAAMLAGALLLRGATLPGFGVAPVMMQPATLPLLFVAGLKGGMLTFGGAYTAIPYVRADTVGRGWLSDGTFLDGVATAGVLPAPLVIFATFAGFMAGGLSGALAITLGMFLPAFAFSMIFFERLEAVVENAALHRLLEGVAAAVVGVIGATLIQLGLEVWHRTTNPVVAVSMFAFGIIVLFRLRGGWVIPALVGVSALIGLALEP